jgi:hypothetical protein
MKGSKSPVVLKVSTNCKRVSAFDFGCLLITLYGDWIVFANCTESFSTWNLMGASCIINSLLWNSRMCCEHSTVQGHCHVYGVCVTNKTGFGFYDRFIGHLYNLLQQLTNHWRTVIIFWLDIPRNYSDWTPLYSIVLLQFWSELRLTVPSYNSSARTPRKTSSVVINASLMVCYLAMDDLLLRAYASGMCLPSRYIAMNICVTIFKTVWNLVYRRMSKFKFTLPREKKEKVALL